MNVDFDKPDRLDFPPQSALGSAPGTLTQNLTTAFDVAKYNGGTGENSKAFTMLEVWRPIVEEIRSAGGDFGNPASFLFTSPLSFDVGDPVLYDSKVQNIYDWLDINKESLPDSLADITPESIDQTMKDFVALKEQELAELARTRPDLAAASARFIGAMGTSIADPVTQVTMPFGGWSKSLWKNVMQNAAVNAGAGAITELDVAKWYDELGLEYTYQDFLTNVAIQGAFGGAMPLAGRGIQMTWQQAQKGFEVLAGKGSKPVSVEDQAIVSALESQAEVETSNPLTTPENPLAGDFEHQNRLTTAQVAINNNEIPQMPEQPTSPINPAVLAEAADNLDGVLYTFNANDIAVDAKTFQFKEGGDEFGVTERLQGITTWDKYKAGVITVYEYADGSLAIADGHQRLGLAKRIMSQDPSQEVKIIGYKLRERDGVSPEEARVIAAMKNIAEGTGTSIDAAKVLRVDPSRISELPPRSELVRQARDMMGLSDQAFGAIINGVVPPNYGAIVGRLIDDPGLQDAAIQVLSKAEPSNAFQAESIVRQVREAGAEEVEQISLFGEELVTESFYIERAKVLDRAYKELRRDKAAFETLVRNSERLEAEGNVLVKDANERKATTDGQTIALLQTLANRKGPLSDALNEAARTARDTNSYAAATSGFLDAVRGSIESGDFDRLSTGDIGRSINDPPQITRSEAEAEPALDGFDEPTGIAAERQADQLVQDLFGADEVDADSIAGLKRLLDESPTRDQIDNHPSVIKALDEMEARAETSGLEGYNTEAWHNSRVYRIDDQDVTSTAEAMVRFERDAEQLAFKELGIDPQPVLRNKELTIVLGPPAAGKSTIANELAVVNRSAILDSDDIKKAVPEYEGGIGASAVHQESSDLAKILQSLMIEQGTNIVLPKIGHTASSIRKAISLYKDKGYKVSLVNMDVTPENAYQRMIRRFVSSGRIIPPAYLDAVGANPSATFRTLRQEGAADGYAEIDNNGGFNEPKEIREVSGDNPLSGSSFDVPSGGRTGPDAIRVAERDSATYSLEKTQPTPDGEIADDTGVPSPGVKTDITTAGEQLVIPGAERISDRDLAERQMQQGMAGGAEAMPEGGLFDDVRSGDLFDDMDLEVPLGQVWDEGKQELVATTMTVRDLKAQLVQEAALVERLEFCTI